MGLNIRINEENIINGDTSPVRKELEVLTENSALIKKYQNSVGLTFLNLTLFDIVRKLKTEEYRGWFRKLDREIPGLPHFLSDKDNALLIYLMGNIKFSEVDGGIIFDRMEANRFFKEKQAQIRNLCLSNNINPESDLNRISAILSGRKNEEENGNPKESETRTDEEKLSSSSSPTEQNPEEKVSQVQQPAKKRSQIKDLLDKYGSIAFMTNDRVVKLTISLDELPGKLAFSHNFLVKDNKFPQSFFSSVMTTEKGNMEIRSLIIPDLRDVEYSIGTKNGVQIQVVHKMEDGSYQNIFESDKIYPVKTTSSIEEELLSIKTPAISPAEPETPPEKETENPEPVKEPAKEPVKDTGNADIERLVEENRALVEKVSKLEKLVEVYEEEIHKQRSVKGFFKKFLG